MPKYAILFFVSCFIDYVLVEVLSRVKLERSRKIVLALSVLINLGGLVYFKYTNFFIDQINTLAKIFGGDTHKHLKIILPVGISFFTFHKISYVVDIYRRISAPAKNFVQYLLYISFFPQLIAGPIIRFHDIEHQLSKREATFQRFFDGLFCFSIGLAKKVLIADSLAGVADAIFKLTDNGLTTEWAWVGILAYAFQIYFDFSGYSDMAIGLAKIFGFDFLENFNRPYISQSITEFWKRWHISLSRWMRDYLYIPLGGNRVSALRNYFNLFIVFVLSGFWHGASWNFIIWGMIHGSFVIMDRLFIHKLIKYLPRFVNVALTFLVVLVAWVFFRSKNLDHSLFYLERMFVYHSYVDVGRYIPRSNIMQNYSLFAFTLATLLCFVPVLPLIGRYFSQENIEKKFKLAPRLQFGLTLFMLFLSVLTLATDSYKAFIYFRF